MEKSIFLTVPCTTDTYKPAQSTYLAEDYCVVLFQQKKNKIERYRRKIVSFQPQNLFGQSPDDFFPTFESVPVTSETNRPAQTTSLELNVLEKKKTRKKNQKLNKLCRILVHFCPFWAQNPKTPKPQNPKTPEMGTILKSFL